MKRVLLFATMIVVCCVFVGCAAHIHEVGGGAKGNDVEQARQWYILFGLVPLNDVDTAEMVGDSPAYTIKTEASALDIIMNMFTGMVTVRSRTVTVTQ